MEGESSRGMSTRGSLVIGACGAVVLLSIAFLVLGIRGYFSVRDELAALKNDRTLLSQDVNQSRNQIESLGGVPQVPVAPTTENQPVVDAQPLRGPIGETGETGRTGRPGADGAPAPTFPPPTNGTDGTDGTDGLNGRPAPIPPVPADGVDGANGTNGADGTSSNGVDGTDGSNGTNGTDGATGSTGPVGGTGAEGRSVTSVVVDEACRLQVTYSDGTTQDAGQVCTPTPAPTPASQPSSSEGTDRNPVLAMLSLPLVVSMIPWSLR